MRLSSLSTALVLVVLPSLARAAEADGPEPVRVLIVDGQNNHKVWPQTTPVFKETLEETGRFTVDVATSAPEGTDPDYRPDFAAYDVVLSNFGFKAAPWPEETQADFEAFMRDGGGLVVVHAADNAWPEWEAFNEMIALGGWGGRNEKSGPYVYYNDAGERVVDDSPGKGGGHDPQRSFAVDLREPHPITDGLPQRWQHANDELYDRLRGPAENLTILATAKSDSTGRHEPMLMVVDWEGGRVFHTTLGHGLDSVAGEGFRLTLARGTEWAATGEVTLPAEPMPPVAED